MVDPNLSPLDILIASEQSWANAASVLGRPGDAGDVLWIESPLARLRGWSRGASVLLQSEGFRILPSLEVTEAEERDFPAFQATLRAFLAKHDARPWHLHLNGGTKLLSTVVQEVVGNRADLHYSEPGRHHLRSFFEWRAFEPKLKVRLADLLTCYGMETDRAGLPTDRILGTIALEAGFSDRQRAFQTFQLQRAESFGRGVDDAGLNARWVAYDRSMKEALRQHPVETLTGLADWICSREGQAWFTEYRRRLRPNRADRQIEADLRHFVENLNWEAQWRQGQIPAEVRPAGPHPDAEGARYERRVIQALGEVRERFGVLDQLNNLRVFRSGSDALFTEMDHVWLLPSGRVVVFEAKAGSWQVKDLRSRMQTYRACFGSATQAILVRPPVDLTDPAQRSESERSRENAEALGLGYLEIPLQADAPVDPSALENRLHTFLGAPRT